MGGWTSHKGIAVALPADNIDTDQLIPARFMSAPRSQGYGDFLMHDMRRDEDGKLIPEFPLNRQPDAGVIVAGRNFGSGSSREAAVYALVDAGIKVVIASSFGDIFASNAINNGLLPACVSPDEASTLLKMLDQEPFTMSVDLESSQILVADESVHFQLDENWRTKLINGWDDIDLTLQLDSQIASYKKQRMQAEPWALLASGTSGAG